MDRREFLEYTGRVVGCSIACSGLASLVAGCGGGDTNEVEREAWKHVKELPARFNHRWSSTSSAEHDFKYDNQVIVEMDMYENTERAFVYFLLLDDCEFMRKECLVEHNYGLREIDMYEVQRLVFDKMQMSDNKVGWLFRSGGILDDEEERIYLSKFKRTNKLLKK